MNIDFKLLNKQKLTLLQVIERYEALQAIQGDLYSKTVADDLTGILHLIDALQDDAVKNGTPEEELEILRKGFDISPEDFDKFLTYIRAGIFDQECSLEGELENWAINVKQIKE